VIERHHDGEGIGRGDCAHVPNFRPPRTTYARPLIWHPAAIRKGLPAWPNCETGGDGNAGAVLAAVSDDRKLVPLAESRT